LALRQTPASKLPAAAADTIDSLLQSLAPIQHWLRAQDIHCEVVHDDNALFVALPGGVDELIPTFVRWLAPLDLVQWSARRVAAVDAREHLAEAAEALLDLAYRLPLVAIGRDARDGEVTVTVPQLLAGSASMAKQMEGCVNLLRAVVGAIRESISELKNKDNVFQRPRGGESTETLGSRERELIEAARELIEAVILEGRPAEPVFARHVTLIGPALGEVLDGLLAPLTSHSDVAAAIARLWDELGTALHELRAGDRATNLEEAIACYTRALQVYTRDAYSEQWAATQHSLGAAYFERLAGERAANLEEAIACHSRALQVRTHRAYPEEWAMTQNSLGNAYRDRLMGDRAANIEEAIACFTRAEYLSGVGGSVGGRTDGEQSRPSSSWSTTLAGSCQRLQQCRRRRPRPARGLPDRAGKGAVGDGTR